MRLLNIGAGSKNIQVPPWYGDWEMLCLDINPAAEPDYLMDAMDLDTLEADQFDAAYASHLLEHIALFNLERFLGGVRHVLAPDGFAEFRVPNVLAACRVAVSEGSLSAFCYESPFGDVTAIDMLYGHELYQMAHGEPMVHHNAFDAQRLADTLNYYGFPLVYVQRIEWELRAIACLTDLSETMKKRMHIG